YLHSYFLVKYTLTLWITLAVRRPSAKRSMRVARTFRAAVGGQRLRALTAGAITESIFNKITANCLSEFSGSPWQVADKPSGHPGICGISAWFRGDSRGT